MIILHEAMTCLKLPELLLQTNFISLANKSLYNLYPEDSKPE
jgi:hypothetical protein